MSEIFELNPFRLWSLMDILRVYAEKYIALGQMVTSVISFYEAIQDRGNPLNEQEQERIRSYLNTIKDHCDQLKLIVSSNLLTIAITDPPQNGREFVILNNAVKAEIKTNLFLFIPPHRAKYHQYHDFYKEPKVDNFPESSKDLIRAGNCFALGEYTASVFHSMCAAERGMRAWAIQLDITFSHPLNLADWKIVVEQIESKIKAMQNLSKSAQKDDVLSFCSAAGVHFRYLKDAYRIHVMHARETYDEGQALSIMEHTKEFLEGLSSKLKEMVISS